jgi:hypothetical protein
LAQAQVRIIRPDPYTTSADSGDGTVKNAGTTHTAPLIPPITPTFAGSGGSQNSSKRPSAPSSIGTGTDGRMPTGMAQPSDRTQQPGLVLGGAPPPGTSPASPRLAPVASPPPSIGLLSPHSNAGFLPGIGPLPPGGGARPATGAQVVRGLSEEIGNGVTRGLRAMPPGGLIGGNPGSGLGEPGAPRPETRRVNPVGGIIGEGEPGARGGLPGVANFGAGVVPGSPGAANPGRGKKAGGRGLSTSDPTASTRGRQGASGSYGQVSGRRSTRRDQSDSSRWDPDNPWVTAEGVDPVVLPPREQRIDPGPAIGLN